MLWYSVVREGHGLRMRERQNNIICDSLDIFFLHPENSVTTQGQVENMSYD